MLRDFSRLNIYLNRLISDIYPQPPDEGHTTMAYDVFDKWIVALTGVRSVLDAGCGDTAFMKSKFEGIGMKYTGIAIGVNNPEIYNMDFTFTEFENNQFDLVFARHALEHSPMPIITLMEWHRIAKHFLCLVNPNPAYYGTIGRNHYSVVDRNQLVEWARLANWFPIWEDDTNNTEIRIMFEKVGEKK